MKWKNTRQLASIRGYGSSTSRLQVKMKAMKDVDRPYELSGLCMAEIHPVKRGERVQRVI